MTLGLDAWITLGLLVLLVIALIREIASPDLLLFTVLVALMFTGVLTPGEALVGFASSAVLAIAALFVIATAVTRSGALQFLYPLMKPRGSSPRSNVARLALPSAAISAFTNNTPLVAILTPLARKWSLRAGVSPSKLLLPMAFATTLGGLTTLIGTSTNLLVSGMLEAEGHGSLGLWEMSAVGVPIAIAGILYLIVASPSILAPRVEASLDSEATTRRRYLFELTVPAGSPLDGKTIEEAGLRNLEAAFVAHIHRHDDVIGPVTPEQILSEGDVLGFVGDSVALDELLARGDLIKPLEEQHDPETQLPLFHAVVASHSVLEGETLRDVDFRNRYDAVVIGIHRGGERVTTPIGRTRLRAGDLLLIESHTAFESAATLTGDFYLVTPVERKAPVVRSKAPAVLILVVAMITVVSFGWLDLVTAALAVALLLVATRVISAAEARRALNIQVLLLVASGIGIGQAFQTTGLAEFFAGGLISITETFGPVAVLAAVYLLTMTLTEILTNQASAVLVLPVAIVAALDVGASPHAFAIAVAIAASAGFATPIGYQTNLMVMGPGGYRFSDYVRLGLPLNIIVASIAIPMIAWLWL